MSGKSKKVWVQILRVGTWTDSQGKEASFDEADLDEIVDAYNDIGEDFKPPIRLGGHDGGLAPAVGWIGGLKREGGMLLALFTDMAPIAAQAINRGLYRNVSSGLRLGWKYGEKTFGKILHHVAVLGAQVPAIKGLEDLPALFTNDEDAVRNFSGQVDNKNESENVMDLAEAKIKIADQQREIETLNGRIETAGTNFSDAESSAAEKLAASQAEVAEFKSKAVEVEVTAAVDSAIASGRCLPAQKENQIGMGVALSGLTFSDGEANAFENWKANLETGPKAVEFSEKSEDGHSEDEKMSEFEEGYALGEKFQNINKG